jgi:hypothetical protein
MTELERRSADEDPEEGEAPRREFGRRGWGQRVGPAGGAVIAGALVLGVVLLLVGYSAAAVTCAVTAGVLWLLLQIPDEPESDDAAPSSARPHWSSSNREVPVDRLGVNALDSVENKEGALVSAHEGMHHDNGGADASDAACLLSAAVRLRKGSIGREGRYEHRSRSATSHLRETLGHALVRGADSIPPEVTRAALRLARASCDSSRSASVGADARDHDRYSPSSHSTTPPGARGAGSRLTPFTSSVRLGRMG